jgi:hypothetical protein
LLQQQPRLRACRDFESLYSLIHHTVGHLRRIGPLVVYDTANRIGGKLGLEPSLVYLHAGTLHGARALGLPTQNGVVKVADLPRALRRLRPREVGDALYLQAAPSATYGRASAGSVPGRAVSMTGENQ